MSGGGAGDASPSKGTVREVDGQPYFTIYADATNIVDVRNMVFACSHAPDHVLNGRFRVVVLHYYQTGEEVAFPGPERPCAIFKDVVSITFINKYDYRPPEGFHKIMGNERTYILYAYIMPEDSVENLTNYD